MSVKRVYSALAMTKTETQTTMRIEVNADALYKLEDAMLRLICESIHYKNTGVGKEFLQKAIDNADSLLSEWKQTRPAPMRV